MLTSEGNLHRRQRRLAQPAFHPQRVAGYADAMVRISADTAHGWGRKEVSECGGVEIDVHEQMMRLTLRIVAKTLFDSELDSEIEMLGSAMNVVVERFMRAVAPWGPLLDVLPLPGNFRFKRSRRALVETVQRFIAQRRADFAAGRTDRADLLSVLLRATDSEDASAGGMSDEQLRDESLTIFTAGHETTANALTFTWYLLAQNLGAETALHDELAEVLNGQLPRYEDLDRLPYARAVVAEAMRLYPPAWAVARQCLDRVDVAGRTWPAGTIFLCSQWVTHRDSRWWPEPERFDPRRWLPGGHAVAPDRPRYAYFPFGGGPRVCIGEAFAWTESILALATIAQIWRLRLSDPNAPLQIQPTITLRPKRGLRMRMERR